MTVIDLTHKIKEGMPVFPGTKPPSLTPASSYEVDKFKETLISMYSHTGTHVDPPAHIIKGAKALDEFDASFFVGSGLVIDCRTLNKGEEISLEMIKSQEKAATRVDFLLFCTGWDKLWDSEDYFDSYPVLSLEALDYIMKKDLKGIGFDTIGLDPLNTLVRHKRLFSSKEIINIENLKNLDVLIGQEFTLACLPINIQDSDGAPARAIAIL